MRKIKKSIIIEHGDMIEGVQIPYMCKPVIENGRSVARVGKQRPLHFFGQGKSPLPCAGPDICRECIHGRKPTYKYKVVVVIKGEPFFIDLDASLSGLIASIQTADATLGLMTSEIQTNVYRITRNPRGVRPCYIVEKIGRAPLPKSIAVDVSQYKNEVISIEEPPRRESAPKAAPTKKEDVLSDLEDLNTELLESKPVNLTEEQLALLRGFSVKMKSILENDPLWDYEMALKTALKKKGWSREEIDLALTKFDERGNYVG